MLTCCAKNCCVCKRLRVTSVHHNHTEDRMQIASLRCLRQIVAISLLAIIGVLAFPVSGELRAQANGSKQQSASDKPFVVEYYYKAKWSHAEEFISMFKKTHYTVLNKDIEHDRLLKV